MIFLFYGLHEGIVWCLISGNKKSGTLTGLAKGLFGGNDKEKKEEAEKKNNEEDSGFKAGDLLRPEKIVKGAKDIVYAVKPDAVDWIDWVSAIARGYK